MSEPTSIILNQDPKSNSAGWLHAEFLAKAEIAA
jgi:hypothetical protein